MDHILLSIKFGEGSIPLKARFAGFSEIFKSSYGKLNEDRIVIDGVACARCFFGGDKCGSGMSKEIGDEISFFAGRSDYPFDGFEGFLRVASGDVFVHAVEDLLDVDPDISGTNAIGLAPFEVFCFFTVYRFIISFEYFWDVGIYNGKVRVAFCVVQKLLSNMHPVFLCSVSPLISHGDKVSRIKPIELPHHDHEFGQRLEGVLDVCAKPDI